MTTLTPGTQVILRSVAIYDADGTVVGEVNAPFGREDEAMARARLWAAAEEMREALAALLGDVASPGLHRMERVDIERARAVLAQTRVSA